jgi:hypothetical protein
LWRKGRLKTGHKTFTNVDVLGILLFDEMTRGGGDVSASSSVFA